MATATQLTALYDGIEAQLDSVRESVRRQWTDAFSLVYGPGSVPPRLGGKMLRPALCFMSAGAAGAKDLDHYIDMATAMELLHMASLAHDDVVDSANMRHGETSLNVLWDNHTAVLGGDYLVARALSILTVYDSCPVLSSALDSIHEMAEGELINFGRASTDVLNEQDCIRLSEKKTASLFATSCRTPSILLGGEHRDAFHAYGMGMGTAFQLVDDLLDLEQDAETLGKPACGDIVEGKTTLPMIYMREAMTAEEQGHLNSLVGNPLTDEDREWVTAMVHSTGAHERTDTLSREYVHRGVQALDPLPSSSYRDTMLAIAEFTLIRES